MQKKILSFIPALLLISFVTCGGSGSGDSKTRNEDQPNIFFEAAKNAGPVFVPSAVKAPAGTEWSVGYSIYQIYLMFQDPDADTGSSVGLDNIYKLVYQAGQFFNECEKGGISIEDTEMTSPFLGMTGTYNKYYIDEVPYSADEAGSYFATKKDGDNNYALLCWYIDYGDNNQDAVERGILQGSYNEATGNINIDLVCFVDYKKNGELGHTTMSMRTHLEGNAIEHSFNKLLSGRWNYGDFDFTDPGVYDPAAGYLAWYVGSGVSRGEGEQFLFMISDNGIPGVGVTNRYFIFPADADEDTLKNLDDAGLDAAGVSGDPLDTYQATIDTIVSDTDNYYNDVLTANPSDVPKLASDFNGTGKGNMKPAGMP